MQYAVITVVGGIATCKLFDTNAAAVQYAHHGGSTTGVPHFVAKVES